MTVSSRGKKVGETVLAIAVATGVLMQVNTLFGRPHAHHVARQSSADPYTFAAANTAVMFF
jgi:hypothetical protein